MGRHHPPALATYDAEGTLLMRFLYADARTPFGADTHAGRVFFAYDQTGSLRTVAGEDGSLLKSVDHDSFGNLIADSAPELEVPLGFAGGLYDADTGLTLFGARDYDAGLGRWIAKDPIGFAGGDANLYGYCLGDPVNLVDPSGLLGRDTGSDKSPEGVVVWQELTKGAPLAPYIPSAIDRIDAFVRNILNLLKLAEAAEAACDAIDTGEEVRDVLNGLRPSDPGKFEIANEEDLIALRSRLMSSGQPAHRSGYPGTQVEYPDGTWIGSRESKEYGLTLDVNVDGYSAKIHLPKPANN